MRMVYKKKMKTELAYLTCEFREFVGPLSVYKYFEWLKSKMGIMIFHPFLN